MASRFGPSTLHQRDPRSDLFRGYTGSSSTINRTMSASPASGYRHSQSSPYSSNQNGTTGGSSGYGGYGAGVGGGYSHGAAQGNPYLGVGGETGGRGFRAATPNKKGQYSDAVLNELESQNEQQVEGIMGKVKLLKDMTIAIGDEIRESSALAEKMNEGFDQTRLRLRGTMNRMLLMAERTGVGWKAWLGFFVAVIILFIYVWLF